MSSPVLSCKAMMVHFNYHTVYLVWQVRLFPISNRMILFSHFFNAFYHFHLLFRTSETQIPQAFRAWRCVLQASVAVACLFIGLV